MQIWLSEDNGCPMWFLGTPPRDLIVSLTFAKPGPVEIDFSSLDKEKQKQVIGAINSGVIESSVSSEVLYQEWLKSTPSILPTIEEVLPMEEEEIEQLPQAKKKILDKVAKIERQLEHPLSKRLQKENREKANDDCKFILRNSIKAIRSWMTTVDDIKLLRTLLEMEISGKNRVGVTASIRDRISRLEKRIQELIGPDRGGAKEATDGIEVVESEIEEIKILLTPSDIVRAAAMSEKR